MSGLTQAKQIAKFQAAFVGISSFSTAGGSSDAITAALTTALSSAAFSGGSVPLQVGSPTNEGVDTAPGFNTTKIYLTATGKNYTDGNGNDVYGKITFASNAYTLSYFSAPGGTETAFAMPAAASIAFDVPYIFSFADLPLRALTGVSERHVAPDLAAYGFRMQPDALTVTSTNTLSALSQTYVVGMAQLNVNGIIYASWDPSPAFTISGKTVTWNATNAGFPLATTDDVTIAYTY